jgi:hypothetical protein
VVSEGVVLFPAAAGAVPAGAGAGRQIGGGRAADATGIGPGGAEGSAEVGRALWWRGEAWGRGCSP